MEANKLYARLEKDFIKSGLSDDWASHMEEVRDFLSENFKERSMGLVCDFAEKIDYVFSAVFPSDNVLEKILATGKRDAMLFVHHPSIWDIRKAPKVFQQMNRDLLEKLKERRISIYNLHVPLDNFGEYSTGVTLSKKLGLTSLKPCIPYYGSLAGVIGKSPYESVQELQSAFQKVVGHAVKLYQYGDEKIAGRKVIVVAGGGNDEDLLKEVISLGINTVVTGISSRNPHSESTHAYEEREKINVLGGTHYSTEKFACQAMCDYFKKLGLDSSFIEDDPVMEDE
jgi:putative NIF3 family GTP cyclohydrolase 1 type 2